MGYSYLNNYSYNNYYPNVFAMNYVSPSYYGGGVATSSYSAPVTYSSSSAAVTNPVKVNSGSSTKTAIKPSATNSLGQEFISVARKYLGCSEYDGSHLKFCNNPTCRIEDPLDEEWCTDFVTYVVKEAYQNKGQTPPAGLVTMM